MIPTFETDLGYNYSVSIEIVFSWNNFGLLGRERVLIEKDVVYAVKVAAVYVRVDLNEIDDVECEVVNVENYNQTNTSSIWELIVILPTERVLEGFINDIDHVAYYFEDNLMNYWNLNNKSGVDSVVQTFNIEQTTTSAEPEGTAEFVNQEGSKKNNLELLEEYYYYVMGSTGILFLLVGIGGLIESKLFGYNELYNIGSMFVISAYFMDVLSDYFFVVQVYLTYSKYNNQTELIVFILSSLFMLIPILSNFIQLHKEVGIWLKDPESKLTVNAWIQSNLRTLYGLSILFGSAHSAVLLCNCNIFQISSFNMGLNRRQRAVFKNKRLFSTVLLENLPQLCLQLTYSLIIDDYTFITIFASIFSFLSILLTIFEYISADSLLKCEGVLVIKMFIESNDISTLNQSQFKKFENLRKPISHEISKITNIDQRLIELLKPKQTKDGCYLLFHIRIAAAANVDYNYSSYANDHDDKYQSDTENVLNLIRNEISSGKLAKSFHKQWMDMNIRQQRKRWKVPAIKNIETKFLSPEKHQPSRKGEKNDMPHAVIKMVNTRINVNHNAVGNNVNPILPSQSASNLNIDVQDKNDDVDSSNSDGAGNEGDEVVIVEHEMIGVKPQAQAAVTPGFADYYSFEHE